MATNPSESPALQSTANIITALGNAFKSQNGESISGERIAQLLAQNMGQLEDLARLGKLNPQQIQQLKEYAERYRSTTIAGASTSGTTATKLLRMAKDRATMSRITQLLAQNMGQFVELARQGKLDPQQIQAIIHQLNEYAEKYKPTTTTGASTFGTTATKTSASLQGEGPSHNAEKRFPNDLTTQVTRDGYDPVASGGFADIYRGMLQKDGESIKVAIKAIKTYSGEDGDFAKKQKRLRREIKVWLNLRHVDVLPLLGTTMGFGRFPAMVCPWVENGVLTSYLENHHDSLSVIEILGLLINVASGLQYLHSRSIVHGDLSGSNVLIRENGRACISDFGLSMLLTELGGSTFATSLHARGTLRWTAPELLDLEVPEDGMEEEPPHGAFTTQSDVYSFGGVMLQILSGKVPYHYYAREAQVVHAVSKGMTPRRPSGVLITECRWMFIKRCWSTVDVARSRPSSEEIVEFTTEELAGASAL